MRPKFGLLGEGRGIVAAWVFGGGGIVPPKKPTKAGTLCAVPNQTHEPKTAKVHAKEKPKATPWGCGNRFGLRGGTGVVGYNTHKSNISAFFTDHKTSIQSVMLTTKTAVKAALFGMGLD